MPIRFLLHGYGQSTAGYPLGPCRWPHFDLLAVHSGTAVLHFMERVELVLTAGQSVMIFPETYFVGSTRAESNRISVQHFALTGSGNKDLLPAPLGKLTHCRHGYEFFAGPMSPALEGDIDRAIALSQLQTTDDRHALRVALLTLIIGQLQESAGRSSAASPDDPAVEKVTLWLNRHLDAQVNLPAMARVAGLSTSHLRHRFQKSLGIAPARYLRVARMHEAARLLRETPEPIKTIARRIGYPEIAHFHRVFRRQIGKTPADYRNEYTPRG